MLGNVDVGAREILLQRAATASSPAPTWAPTKSSTYVLVASAGSPFSSATQSATDLLRRAIARKRSASSLANRFSNVSSRSWNASDFSSPLPASPYPGRPIAAAFGPSRPARVEVL